MGNTARRFSRYLPVDRSRLRYWLVVSGVFLIDAAPGPFASGTALLLAGMALHLWAKGTLEQNRILAQGGPYRWVRHPFYLSNALIDLGLCFMINRGAVFAVYFIFWFIGYSRAIEREERRLAKEFGETFRQYRAETPCFFPWKIPGPRGNAQGFSWQNRNIAGGSELPRLLRLAGYPLLLFAASEFHDTGISFWTELGRGFVALWLFLFLSCASFIVKRTLQRNYFAMPRWSTSVLARNAFVFAIVAFGFLFPFMELEMDPEEFALAAVLVGGIFLHLFAFRRTMKSHLGILAEGTILTVICFVAELPWLSLLPLSYYAALWLDGAGVRSGTPLQPIALLRDSLWLRLQAILAIGIGLMLWKELFDDRSGLLLLLHWSS